ncbi:MAG: hypothetical protein KF709_12740 [Gemmatimonadaceae bacterium]|nr:hypothetical protein [Gemmatimonadaceae bacterium]
MKVWIGGEVSAAAYDAFRPVRNAFERALNHHLGRLEIGGGVVKWSIVPMLLAADTKIQESYKYRSRTREVEAHVAMDIDVFLASDRGERIQQLASVVKRVVAQAGHHGTPPLADGRDLLATAVELAAIDASKEPE